VLVKRSWGRLGAAVGAVVLLAGGLVSVAAPVQANPNDVATKYLCDQNIQDYFAYCKLKQGGPYTLPDCLNALLNGINAWPGNPDNPGKNGLYLGEVATFVEGTECRANYTEDAPRVPTPEECEGLGQVLNGAGTKCRDKTDEEKCEESGKYWYDNSCNEKSPSEKKCEEEGGKWDDGKCVAWKVIIPIVDVIDLDVCPDGSVNNEAGKCIPVSAIECEAGFDRGGDGECAPVSGIECEDGSIRNGDGYCVPVRAGDTAVDDAGDLSDESEDGGTSGLEPVQKNPPPPPCWDPSLNNCPVGGALRFVAPEYAMVGVPVTMYAYVSWRPDANSPAQPTNGTAVIRVDGEDYSGVEFVDGVAQWRFIPETEGMKEFTASGVVSSGISGANAYIDSVPARTYVLEYDPAAYTQALKKKRVEVGETYVITDPNQARSYLKDRYEWSVSDKSDDVCAVYETKKGAVKAKFNGEGKCTVIWMDKESADEGKYTFIAKK
jgi:hypothetical protein